MSERRASMRPPEMMNGSTKGRVSSCSSTLAMCTCGHVEEVQLAAPALERTSCPELEHPSDESVLRVKHERVERALGARALGRGILGQGKLEERVELDALAAAPAYSRTIRPEQMLPGPVSPGLTAGAMSRTPRFPSLRSHPPYPT